MTTVKQRVYVRDSYLPFEEDETHEFKGHREIAPEDTPPWAFHNPCERQTRQAISRNLNAFLNTGRGGVVYCGVDDRGRVLGLHMTRYQRDHVQLSVRDLFMRYRPAVPSNRYRIKFVPVVSKTDADIAPTAFTYDVSRRQEQHWVATSKYCWCEADARARTAWGVIPLSYVIEIEILPWAARDQTLHPFYLSESGRCYVRRQASIVPLSAADCIRITRHEAAVLSRRQSEQMALASQRAVSALQSRLDSGQLRSTDLPACCCAVGSDEPLPTAGESAEPTPRTESEAEGGESRTDRAEQESHKLDMETPDRSVSQSSSSETELTPACPSGFGITQGDSTDGELTSLAQNSPPDAGLSRGRRTISHSSSSDSGICLNSSSDTCLTKEPLSDFPKQGSSSSGSVTPPQSTRRAAAPAGTADSGRVTPRSPEVVSGTCVVSELLQHLLSSSIPPDVFHDPPLDNPVTPEASSAGSGAAGDSTLPPSRRWQIGSDQNGDGLVTSPSAGEAAPRPVSRLDLGENGSEMSLLALDRLPVDRDGGRTDLGRGDADLETGEEIRRASEIGSDESGVYMGGAESNMGTVDTKVNASEVGYDISVADVASEMDLSASETNFSVLQASLDVDIADPPAGEEANLDSGRAGLGTGVTGVSLLELGSAAIDSPSGLPDTACDVTVIPLTDSVTPSLPVTTQSESESTAETDSGQAAATSDKSPTCPVSGQSVSAPPAERRSPGASAGGDGSGEVCCSPPGVTVRTGRLPQGIRGRGKMLEWARNAPAVVGKASEAEVKSLKSVWGFLNPDNGMSMTMGETEGAGRVLQTTGKMGTLSLGEDAVDDSALDSDDSGDSWNAGFRPEKRAENLTDSATVD